MKKSMLLVSSMGLLAVQAYANEIPNSVVLPTLSSSAEADQSLKNQVGQASTATKGLAELKDIPQIVNVVPQEILRDQTVTSMQGALQNVAGLSFSVGDGQRDQVMIRGFSAITDNYVDGVRDDALYYRDMSNVERIEVLKGPGSVLYGRGSAGGLVNRINKKPLDEKLHEVSLIGSSLGQKRAELDLAEIISDQVKVRLTGAIEDSDGYRHQSFLKREAIAPSLQWNVSDQTSILLQADYLHDDRLADQGFPMDPLTGKPVRTNTKTFYGALNGEEVGNVDTEVSSQTITLEHKFNDLLKYRGVARHYNYSLDREYSTDSHPSDPSQIVLIQNKRLRNEDGIFLQNEISAKMKTPGLQHEVLIGVEYSKQHKDEILWQGAKTTTNLYHPVLDYWIPINTATTARNNNSNEFENYALYLQDLITLNDKFKLLAGLRYDDLSQYRNDKTGKTGILDRTDHSLSPRIGIVYQPVSNLSLYASYNRSFQPLADAFVLYKNSADLKPTKTENLEIGTKWDLSGRLNMTLAVFEMNQTNIQNQSPNDNTLAILAGEQKTRGAEVALTGQLTDQLSVLAGYSYLDGKIEKSTTGFSGHHAALTPNHAANLWLKYQLNDQWFAALGGRAESSRFSAPDNKNLLPGYTVFNAALGYQTAQYDVTLNLNNLLNREFFVSGHSGANDSNMLGDPINAQLALRYRF
ncbi:MULTISPECIES: TonB-dependent receptor [unclassified Acinetobacter]|uniref:TonB-dependent receptor n=1 Tax=unclassified Acinetobacter TaxID=196816 RepID=UPI00235F40F5|nr:MULTISPECIES: TonB-dependent siderophore receptor [unclassified Acinetobacter]